MVYSRNVNQETHTFGISGRLYKSNVLFYDQASESLWSQLKSQAIAGPLAGTRLRQIPSSRLSWKKWTSLHPETTVLSDQTGYARNYDRDPYEGYYRVGTIWFPVGDVRRDLSPKARILGIETKEASRAYPLEALVREDRVLKDRIDGKQLSIRIQNNEVVSVRDKDGAPVAHVFAYWFAWQAFHPETEVYDESK